MGYQGEGEGEGEMTWLVGRKVHMRGEAEQELAKALGGKREGVFGLMMGWQVERKVTGKTGRWKGGGTQHVGR